MLYLVFGVSCDHSSLFHVAVAIYLSNLFKRRRSQAASHTHRIGDNGLWVLIYIILVWRPQPTRLLRNKTLDASRKPPVPGQLSATYLMCMVIHVRGASVGSTGLKRSTPRARELQGGPTRTDKARNMDVNVGDDSVKWKWLEDTKWQGSDDRMDPRVGSGHHFRDVGSLREWP